VDDGSTDGTRCIIAPYLDRIQYLYQENQGPASARNTGIEAAAGKYICFLDADDLWITKKLELQVSFMESNPEIGLLFSDHEDFDQNGVVLSSFLSAKAHRQDLVSQKPLRYAFEKLITENFISTPTVIVRKECLRKAGLFDSSIRFAEDWDLWLRIAANSPIACLPLVLCRRRLHNQNLTKLACLSGQGRVEVLKRNRSRFPRRVPKATWRHELARAYLSLAYAQVEAKKRIAGLWADCRSLAYASMAWGPLPSHSAAYSWLQAFGLFATPILGWRAARLLWRKALYS